MFSFEPDPPDHFEDAAKRIVLLQRASISDLEIALDISSAEAKRMMDALEAAGVVSAPLVAMNQGRFSYTTILNWILSFVKRREVD